MPFLAPALYYGAMVVGVSSVAITCAMVPDAWRKAAMKMVDSQTNQPPPSQPSQKLQNQMILEGITVIGDFLSDQDLKNLSKSSAEHENSAHENPELSQRIAIETQRESVEASEKINGQVEAIRDFLAPAAPAVAEFIASEFHRYGETVGETFILNPAQKESLEATYRLHQDLYNTGVKDPLNWIYVGDGGGSVYTGPPPASYGKILQDDVNLQNELGIDPNDLRGRNVSAKLKGNKLQVQARSILLSIVNCILVACVCRVAMEWYLGGEFKGDFFYELFMHCILAIYSSAVFQVIANLSCISYFYTAVLSSILIFFINECLYGFKNCKLFIESFQDFLSNPSSWFKAWFSWLKSATCTLYYFPVALLETGYLTVSRFMNDVVNTLYRAVNWSCQWTGYNSLCKIVPTWNKNLLTSI